MTEKYMTFWEHFAELKYRLKIPAIVFLVSIFIFYPTTSYLMTWFIKHFLGHYENVQMLASTPMVGFITRIKFTLILGLAVTIPTLVFELFRFFDPALHKKHSNIVVKVLLSSLFLFMLGTGFNFFVLVPLMLRFFVMYNAKMGLVNLFAIDTFFMFVILTLFLGGAAFQSPLIIILANRLGFLKKEWLSHSRRWIYLFILIIAGVATPDHTVVSQLALGACLAVLFEISMLFCKKEKQPEHQHKETKNKSKKQKD